MNFKDCCKPRTTAEENGEYEEIRIAKAKNNCHLCDDYADRQKEKPVAVMCCEGACLRGEIARQTANILCHSLVPEKTVRVCLGERLPKTPASATWSARRGGSCRWRAVTSTAPRG